jgi:hypothetical protein
MNIIPFHGYDKLDSRPDRANAQGIIFTSLAGLHQCRFELQLQRKDGNTNQVEIPFSLKMKLLRLTWHQLSTI